MNVRQMHVALAGMVEVLAFAGPGNKATFTIPIGTPGPLPGQWQEVGPRKRPSFLELPLVGTGFQTVRAPRVAPLCFESTGSMRWV
ncbi:hypothetical protein GGQ73_002137 [Rhizobium skierniewicense]|uniref:Uncharacterized protein n=1 Tax=Rhizobium skierniewicense TaxID=984260 RepID=A0A7W6G362_9HYPH|nr:hypothetical protein [Rhizobium skierniewicense]